MTHKIKYVIYCDDCNKILQIKGLIENQTIIRIGKLHFCKGCGR